MLPLTDNAVCVFREMDVYPVGFRIYGNWTEYALFLLPLVGLNL